MTNSAILFHDTSLQAGKSPENPACCGSLFELLMNQTREQAASLIEL
jgi:hypothetical protein